MSMVNGNASIIIIDSRLKKTQDRRNLREHKDTLYIDGSGLQMILWFHTLNTLHAALTPESALYRF